MRGVSLVRPAGHVIRDAGVSGVGKDTFISAVKKRLLADPEVPVGSFCSGGLDSSLVAAIAAEEIPNLHTFVVGMEDENGDLSDDVKAARIAAKHIGSTHHEYIFLTFVALLIVDTIIILSCVDA